MAAANSKFNAQSLIQLVAALVVLVSFFLPWVDWDGSEVSGMAMATGDFFKTSASRFELNNPFPQLSFIFYIFWLIPLLALVIIGLVLTKNKTVPIAFVAGATSLGLVTTYYLFTGILVDLGAGDSVMGMLKPWIYVHAFAAALLIITAFPVKQQGWKIAWLILGPVIAFASFKIGEKQVLGQTHKQTQDVKADFVTTADNLLKEFLANDTAANKKYLDKMVEVKLANTEVQVQEDSTSTLKFADSTGSYLIFSFDKEQLSQVKQIQPAGEVTVKGVCSGSIFSEILGTTSISFKRSTIKNNK